jgi:hypothetical protein
MLESKGTSISIQGYVNLGLFAKTIEKDSSIDLSPIDSGFSWYPSRQWTTLAKVLAGSGKSKPDRRMDYTALAEATTFSTGNHSTRNRTNARGLHKSSGAPGFPPHAKRI